jgi:hypothetical protein
MKKLLLLVLFLGVSATSFAGIKYIDGYYKSDGSYTSGHYRDTSNDGNPYNNANYLGYNRTYQNSGF